MSIPLTTLEELRLLEHNNTEPLIFDNRNIMILPNLRRVAESNSSYLTMEIFLRYFDQLILDIFDFNNKAVCYFKSLFISDYFITINFTTLKYKIPKALSLALSNCRTRFYIIPIALVVDYTDVGHANVVIIDRKLGKIEFFEPHGIRYRGGNFPYDMENQIKNLINILFPGNRGYTYKNVQSHCPVGFQMRQQMVDQDAGSCLAWSLLFIHVRLLNLNRDTDDIILYFHNNFTNAELNIYIRRYIGFLEDFYKKSSVTSELKLNPYAKHGLKLSNTEIQHIEYIIEQLINNYIMEITSIKPNNNKITEIFEELITYHRYPRFNTLFMKIFSDIKNTKQNTRKRVRTN